MKKLTLNVDELRVESFESTVVEAGVGTVRGLEDAKADLGTYVMNCFYTEQRTCTC